MAGGGDGNICDDPFFVRGALHRYCLSQVTKGFSIGNLRVTCGKTDCRMMDENYEVTSLLQEERRCTMRWNSNYQTTCLGSWTCTLFLSLLVLSLVTTMATSAESTKGPNIVPWPQEVKLGEGTMILTSSSRIVAAEKLEPLAKVLSEEIFLLTGERLTTATDKSKSGDISLELDAELKGEAYTLVVDDNVVVRGGNYGAVALGTVTLLQSISTESDRITLPKMTIQDEPEKDYRGLMIDVARRYNSIDELKQCVVMSRLYKIRYLHIHLTDDHAWTFPSKAFPKLGSSNRGFRGPVPKVYKLDDLKDLVRFADERGVTFIPELDMPGHTDTLRIPYPELFDADDGPAHMGLVNMANEKAYTGLDTLIGEMLEVFQSSPYFHIGADEARLDRCKVASHYEPFLKKHKLEDEYDLYIYFIARMNGIVKKHGRQMIVWGDFHGTGSKNVKVPNDGMIL